MHNNYNKSSDQWIELRGIKNKTIESNLYVKTWAEAQIWANQVSEQGINAYYGVAFRKDDTSGTKENCGSLTSLWVDLDREAKTEVLPDFILPPTTIICSGKGLHIYWELVEPICDQKEVERVLKKLCTIYDGDDSLTQYAAILRIPNTLNYKYDPPKPVYEVSSTGQSYAFKELQIAIDGKFDKWLNEAHKDVQSGERSEHEYKLINQLFEFGFSSSTITQLVKYHTSNLSKANENETNLQFTVDKVEEKIVKRKDKKPKQTEDLQVVNQHDIFIGDGCYCTLSKEGNPIPVSNFVYDLKAMLSGNNAGFVCDILVGKIRYENKFIDQKIFSNDLTFKQSLYSPLMVWYGNSLQTMKLKQLLADTWQYEGLPMIQVTKQLGRQFDDKYVVTDGVYDKNLVRQDDILYVEPAHEHPVTSLYEAKNPKKFISDLLNVNDKAKIQTMLGWFVSCHVKPVLQKFGVRFPHLLICGTRGAGKTETITRIFQPLLGYKDIKLWQANSTPFVLLTLLGSTTSVPVCLTEFRGNTQKTHSRFLSTLRSAYDTGVEARGTAGQATNTYLLSSPVCIDGEEMIDDPALLERIIPVYLDKRDIGKSGNALANILKHDIHGAGAYILEYILNLPDESIYEIYRECLSDLDNLNIAQRIKNNNAVVNVGLRLIKDMTSSFDDLGVIFNEVGAIRLDMDILGDNNKLPVRQFLEDLLNYIMSGQTSDIIYRYKEEKEKETGLIGIHLATCYHWWTVKNRQIGLDTPPLLTLRRQMKEDDKIFLYAKNGVSDEKRVMLFQYVNLKEASKVLDIDILD